MDITNRVAGTLVCLPMFYEPDDAGMDYIKSKTKEFFDAG